MKLKESILQILSDKKAKRAGLHVKHIAQQQTNSGVVGIQEMNSAAKNI